MKFIRTIPLLLLLSMPAMADDSLLIKDMESLRDSLPFKDAGRPPLTRRLADLYFQKAVQDDKNLILTGVGNAAEIQALRVRAYKLYSEALDGEKGIYPAVTGEMRTKIEFQLARLDRMMGKRAQALTTFKTIAAQSTTGRDLMRETLLTIAEMQDEDGQWAEAQLAYEKALPLCQNAEAASYVRYRLSWAYFRKGDIARAQNEISQALFDAQGNVKDQVVMDYTQFLAATPKTDGVTELQKMEALAQKTRRPQLIEELAGAFFAIGNREAGVTALTHAQRIKPDPFHAARLAEENYGFRRWDDVTANLNYLKTQSVAVSSMEAKRRETMDQILRRLVVQIDGERKSNPGKYNTESMLAIDTYIALFPKSDVVPKMREGWMAAASDDQMKMERLALWISESKGTADERKFRQERAALALKNKNYTVIREEAKALANTTDVAQKREWTYVEAKAALDSGDDTFALTQFQELAKMNTNPDKWAVQSQHLALDILNKQKKFSELAAQAATWTTVAALKDSSVKADVSEMEAARSQALFEHAASLGATPEALKQFVSFCEQNLFVDKSCPNAKVLAVKLKDQAALITVLTVQNDVAALAAEFERMGQFAKAAALQEKTLKPTDAEMTWIKVATLFQIGGDEAGRTRVLRALSARLMKQGKMSPEQEVLMKASYLTSSLSTSELLRLPWSAATKMKLASDFEKSGRGDAETKKMILSSKEDTGSLWADNALAKVEAADQKQRSITFYGGNSRARFQSRLNSIASLAKMSKEVLEGASTPVRVSILGTLSRAYQDLDREILATPLPEGLDQEQISQVQAAMEELAAPLRAEGESYLKLREEQVAQLDQRDSWLPVIEQGRAAVVAKLKEVEVAQLPKTSTGLSEMERLALAQKLSVDPNDKSVLEKLRQDYEGRGEKAAAAYFSGRLTEMEKL